MTFKSEGLAISESFRTANLFSRAAIWSRISAFFESVVGRDMSRFSARSMILASAIRTEGVVLFRRLGTRKPLGALLALPLGTRSY